MLAQLAFFERNFFWCTLASNSCAFGSIFFYSLTDLEYTDYFFSDNSSPWYFISLLSFIDHLYSMWHDYSTVFSRFSLFYFFRWYYFWTVHDIIVVQFATVMISQSSCWLSNTISLLNYFYSANLGSSFVTLFSFAIFLDSWNQFRIRYRCACVCQQSSAPAWTRSSSKIGTMWESNPQSLHRFFKNWQHYSSSLLRSAIDSHIFFAFSFPDIMVLFVGNLYQQLFCESILHGNPTMFRQILFGTIFLRVKFFLLDAWQQNSPFFLDYNLFHFAGSQFLARGSPSIIQKCSKKFCCHFCHILWRRNIFCGGSARSIPSHAETNISFCFIFISGFCSTRLQADSHVWATNVTLHLQSSHSRTHQLGCNL